MSPYALPEWEAFLAAVASAPDDDLPRLVAADWLEEHGDTERAEFIRLQCELARTTDAQRADQLQWRERELLNSPTGAWLWAVEACPNIVNTSFDAMAPPLRSFSIHNANRVQFRRGFPASVSCTAKEWLHYGASTVPRQPLVSLTLTQCDELTIENWWPMLDTLGRMRSIYLDSRWRQLPKWLSERLPHVDITPSS
jgi:uncharacterized protein (TIGR02996 family)